MSRRRSKRDDFGVKIFGATINFGWHLSSGRALIRSRIYLILYKKSQLHRYEIDNNLALPSLSLRDSSPRDQVREVTRRGSIRTISGITGGDFCEIPVVVTLHLEVEYFALGIASLGDQVLIQECL